MVCDGEEQIKLATNGSAEYSGTSVQIKIKTLDSQTYSLRVDKSVPVPELKRQIASLTGVLSEQQRLICRGRVLKDDQLLSAYHVEDGHTLHLVVRQPNIPSSETSADPASTFASSNSDLNSGNRVLIGSFNVAGDEDESFPDRFISAIINSFGAARFGSGEGIDLNRSPSEPLSNAPRRFPSDQTASADTIQPPTIPDSLTTLAQYLSHLTQEFLAHGVGQNGTAPSAGFHVNSSESRRIFTPESLAEVMSSTRHLIIRQVAGCMQQLAGQLASQSRVTDISERSRIQSSAVRSGALFQNVGVLLLELGRAIMTLRMGQTSADALVNAGPPVFISSSGPNPIMVQPMPFQPGAAVGSVPFGSVQNGPSLSPAPRNVDIRIRTSSFLPRREATGSQTQGQAGVAASTNNQQDVAVQNPNSGSGDSPSTPRPLRTVVANTLASAARGADSSRGIFHHPLFARFVHVSSGNSGGSRTPQHDHSGDAQPTSDSAVHDNVAASNGDHGIPSQNTGAGVEQLISTIFRQEHVILEDTNPEASAEAADASSAAQESSPVVTGEGVLLSHMLRQVLPMLSSDAATVSGLPSGEGHGSDEMQADENAASDTSSHRRLSSQRQPSPKRQRRE